MKHIARVSVGLLFLVSAANAPAQAILKGKLRAPRYPGSSETVPVTAVYCFANRIGSDNQAVSFRTWETHPVGWYYLPTSDGNFTIVFSDPAGYIRPLIRTNQFLAHGDVVDRTYTPVWDYVDFYSNFLGRETCC